MSAEASSTGASGTGASGAGERRHVAVMHGVNLDQLGNRNKMIYGSMTLPELERQIDGDAQQLQLDTSFFQSNHEGAFVEHLHSLRGSADGVLLNPGSWTHYAWAIRDALEIAEIPAIEIHLSDVENREQWRRFSVIRELCFAIVSGQGPDGYRGALTQMREHLDGGA
ncbi:MAG TPA: type II 3-dehydroquinate dehydratase [Solirubrobacteraceae bacterium]|jgi:3-dehydroquinate dehydratase-2|nr:type II 3-dehydroquinate dehydratase [Solirubrobacteraceae bacterium]